MSQFREIQQTFAEAIVEGKRGVVARTIAPDESALQSVALYRRLIRNNYTQVLKVTYPVLHRMVGDRYFGIVARGYFQRHPSTSGDLFPYGRHLSTFLREVHAPPLLVELARLEWACHEVHQASDSPPLPQDQLQAIALVDPSRVTVHFHAASRLLLFPFPVHRVWLALQPGALTNDDIDMPLPWVETGVVVTRCDWKVQITPLTRLDYLLLEAMSRGVDLVSVERMAIEFNPEFDFARFARDVWKLQILNGLSVRDPP